MVDWYPQILEKRVLDEIEAEAAAGNSIIWYLEMLQVELENSGKSADMQLKVKVIAALVRGLRKKEGLT